MLVILGYSATAINRAERLAPDSRVTGESLHQIRQNIAADHVIQGSFLDLGDQTNGQIRVDARLQDAQSGETVDSVIETGSESDLNGLLVKTGADLRQKLSIARTIPQPEQEVLSTARSGLQLPTAHHLSFRPLPNSFFVQ
jgi:hypothetical protein